MELGDEAFSKPIEPRDTDEQKIDSGRDLGYESPDVLCGRDKTSFNHCEFPCLNCQHWRDSVNICPHCLRMAHLLTF